MAQRLAFGKFEVDSKNLAEAILFGEQQDSEEDELTSQSSCSNSSTQVLDPAPMMDVGKKERFTIPRIVTVEAAIPAIPLEIFAPKAEATRKPEAPPPRRTIPSIATIAEMAPILLNKPQLKEAKRRSRTALPDWWMERMAADRAKTAKRRSSWHAADPPKNKKESTKARRQTIAVMTPPPIREVELKACSSSSMEIKISPLKGEVTVVKKEAHQTASSLQETNPPKIQLQSQMSGEDSETASESSESSSSGEYEAATEEESINVLASFDGSPATTSTVHAVLSPAPLVVVTPAPTDIVKIEAIGGVQDRIENKPAENSPLDSNGPMSSGTQDITALAPAEAPVEITPEIYGVGDLDVPRIEGDIAVVKQPMLFRPKPLATGTLRTLDKRDVPSNHTNPALLVMFCAVLWNIIRLI